MKKWFRKHKQKILLILVVILVIALAFGSIAPFFMSM